MVHVVSYDEKPGIQAIATATADLAGLFLFEYRICRLKKLPAVSRLKRPAAGSCNLFECQKRWKLRIKKRKEAS